MRKIALYSTLLILFFTINLMKSQSLLKNDGLNSLWTKDYNVAIKKAKKNKEPILLFFTGSDWCGPCKMLKADFFDSDRFKNSVRKHIVLYEVDFPRNTDLVSQTQKKNNKKLQEKYKIYSFPTVVVINNKGKILGKRHSYNLMRDPSYYFKFLDNILNK